MQLQNNRNLLRLSDDDLLPVSGGSSTVLDDRGVEVKEGRFITSTFSNYNSGEFPKYSIGDSVKIKWRINTETDVLCNAVIAGISDGRNAGLLFRKYTYSVRILSCPNSDMIGLIESGVHENCLFL